MTVRIATRASDLALAQSRSVARRIESALAVRTELVEIRTTGDRLTSIRLASVGGKGLFVKELEEALLDGRADIAVHSAKDVPPELPAALALAAFPDRADPRDALVCRVRGATLATLPRGARVATGSVRRTAQLRAARPDLEVVPIRGNVPTRLRKLEEQGLDALLLACAGLDRLGLSDRIDERVSPDVLLPAATQGVVAIEARVDDPLARDLAALDDPDAACAALAERAFLTGLQGDCDTPIAALTEPLGPDRIAVRGLVATRDGSKIVRERVEAETARAAAAGAELAASVIARGGGEILATLRQGTGA
ncbi:MAG: hydroxymethylbilane synthase [Deltaproteobacteria bacterium]|nr:MAG: hydroxymethylbilane synthase [Deltaproteobacteria bacterium]